jgi:hypothetical protein
MRRLYLQIYATVVAIVVVFALLVGLTWKVFGPTRDDARRNAQGIANVIGRVLPPADAPLAQQQAAIDQLARDLDVLTLRDARRAARAHESGASGTRESGPREHGTYVLRLSDGRTLSAAWPPRATRLDRGNRRVPQRRSRSARTRSCGGSRRLERLRGRSRRWARASSPRGGGARPRRDRGPRGELQAARPSGSKLVAAQRGALASASRAALALAASAWRSSSSTARKATRCGRGSPG